MILARLTIFCGVFPSAISCCSCNRAFRSSTNRDSSCSIREMNHDHTRDSNVRDRTLVYADIDEEETSNASSIASTIQQMSISFGVAAAGLTTAFFVPDSFRSNPDEMIHGIHEAFLILGGWEIGTQRQAIADKAGADFEKRSKA